MHFYHCRVVVSTHTAKTHLYANEDKNPMSPLKYKYYHLNSSDEGFRKSDSNWC